MTHDPVTYLCGLVWSANWCIYFLRNRRFRSMADGPVPARYSVSLPTRLFRYVNIALYVATAINVLLRPGLLVAGPVGPARLASGAVIGAAGILVLYASSHALGRHYKPCYVGAMPSARVTTGPYRYLRHPIYVANTLQFIGMVVLIPSVISVLLVMVLVWCYRYAIRDEDAALDARFPL